MPILGGPGFRPGAREAAGPDPAGRSTALAARMAGSRPGRVWGLVASQAARRAGIGDAFVRLRAYAYARDLRLTDVARDIVARRLRLHPDPSRDGEA